MSENSRRMYELEYPSPEVVSQDQKGPTLVIALQGYADAGHAVDASSRHLLAALDNRLIASFNNDELIDYRSRRPSVTIDVDHISAAEKLHLNMSVLRDGEGKSFLLLSGPEPDLRWEAFTEAVVGLVEKFNVEQTICLYSAPMTVPHTRPLMVSAHGNNKELVGKLFKFDTQMTVPGSASLHIERELHRRGLNVAGYTAHVPHYLAASPYPDATLKLLEAVASTAGLQLPLLALEADARRVATQLVEQVEDSGEIQQIVHALERQYDEEFERYRRNHPQAALPGDQDMPSGEELGAQFEQFLAGLDDAMPQSGSPTAGPEVSGPEVEQQWKSVDEEDNAPEDSSDSSGEPDADPKSEEEEN
ncbi:PAC2 family protein [Corynebacterium occultum]|uniref:PAC2 family protein n=1 Tax=Corynebacterium occultum TaxID=2675219 RepID=A0A6B8VPT0_9CORY|nr:PAC2 family protein [Corynebacterium occultum]QGU07592.1 PAC2 family protein [Corynebacterium occultum]